MKNDIQLVLIINIEEAILEEQVNVRCKIYYLFRKKDAEEYQAKKFKNQIEIECQKNIGKL